MATDQGLSMELGRILGQMLDLHEAHIRLLERAHDESIRQTGVLEQMRDHMERLVERQSSAPSRESAPISGLRELIDSIRRLLSAALPILLLALLAMGKISWADLLNTLLPVLPVAPPNG